ncbi:hypothetical protein BUALT_Bualt04G0098000 [Buddleja alternifolia]|uniref:1,4-alpha-glucan branching enzyme n=1 Tax=Buddleja alternifolia TaxID=168488 RepID=A0AAV6XV59_9LAMI|nr:hypothetical protein BUALT_Bualt04G0098000 [Buddleja alternifolia]
MTDDHSTAANMEEDAENIGLFSLDPGLESYKDHFRYRIRRYVDQRKLIDKHESNLEEFAQGYLKFGFNRDEGCIVYREWAPTAE